MEYFTEQALTYSECLENIRNKYGGRATILMHKNIRMGGFLGFFAKDGVEVTGFVPNNAGKSLNALTEIPPPRMPPPRPAVITDSVGTSGSSVIQQNNSDFEEKKRQVLAAANRGTDTSWQKVLEEVQIIRGKIEAREKAPAVPEEEHQALGRIREILETNDFSSSYSGRILERLKRECSLEFLADYDAVQDKVLEWIGESISIYREEKIRNPPRIMVLVGPTGVGKTTTIAKLAAMYGIGSTGRRLLSVRLITIDAFRIGARQQIEAYGEIMSFPVSYVEDYDDLKKALALYSEGVDLVLIDTMGKSPRDAKQLGEMKQILDACGSRAEIHLALTATTKAGDLKQILRQFEPFGYRSVIITKMDETLRAGNVISTLADQGKSVSYITDGQKVPHDIKKAQVVHFLTNLEDFRVNRAKIEERFSSGKGTVT